jgi:glycosyltransferase involved in cell wall biosynthesis
MQRIIVSVTSDLVADQRVHRVCSTLQSNGYNVLLIGRKLNNKQDPGIRVYKYKRLSLLFNKGFLFYACFNLRLFLILLFSKSDIFLSNDLDTLAASFLASKIKKKKLIYDSHELFTEVPELIRRPKVQKFWLRIEKYILPKLKNCYTVSEPISEYYNQMYGTSFSVIRNLPYYKKQTIDINKRENILIYQGALNEGRGLELLISAMEEVENCKLYIAGSGKIESDLKELCKTLSLSSKIEFLGRIPMDDLYEITRTAILGFSLEQDTGLNYRYALPNKIFDYIQAGVPSLVSPLPEIQKIVTDYNTGELLLEDTASDLAKHINKLIKTKVLLEKYHINCINASKELCWENESNKLIDIVNIAKY